MTEHRIILVGGRDGEFGILTAEKEGETCSLSFLVRGKRHNSSSSDFFETFCQIRRELESDFLIPFCYAASLNVYPSRMSRQMSSGTVAYVLRMGESAETKVHIFETGPDVVPASVDQQRLYFDEWLASLTAKPKY